MEFTINGNEHELKFNIGFIRQLDEVYTADMNGVKFGMGLSMAMVQLQQYNPAALSDVIRAAAKGRINLNLIDTAIEEYADENDGLESLFENVIDGIKKSKVTKDTLNKMQNLSNQG